MTTVGSAFAQHMCTISLIINENDHNIIIKNRLFFSRFIFAPSLNIPCPSSLDAHLGHAIPAGLASASDGLVHDVVQNEEVSLELWEDGEEWHRP